MSFPLPDNSAPRVVEAELVARVRAGEDAAFDELVVQYGNGMVRYATVLLSSADDADDVVQRVLVRLWRLRADWRVTTSVQSYLLGAVRHEALNRRRSNGSVERLAAEAGKLIEEPPALDDVVGNRADLAASLRSLPERRREAVVLRYGLGMTAPQVARVMGITTKAVELLAMRGLHALREWFKRR